VRLLVVLHQLQHRLLEGEIHALAFSPESPDMLAVYQNSAERSISVWNWRDHHLLAHIAVEQLVYHLVFQLHAPRLVTAGKRHLHFWTMEANPGRQSATVPFRFLPKKAIFHPRRMPNAILAVLNAPADGRFLTGDSDGNILVWGRPVPDFQVSARTGKRRKMRRRRKDGKPKIGKGRNDRARKLVRVCCAWCGADGC
jgi:microtubule-associated protein-like 3